MKKYLTVLIAVAFLITLFFIFSCEPTTESSTTGDISGKLLDATSSQPISGASITTSPVTSSKTTDVEGKYLIEGVEPGTYTVQASKSGYKTNSTTVNVIVGEEASADIQLSPLTPELSVSATSLSYGTSSTSLTFTITNSGVRTLTWSIISPANWITVNPTSGSTENESDVVTVTVNRTGMDYGNHYETITIASNTNSKTIDIIMTVPNPNSPQLSAYPVSLDFKSSTVEMTFYISNSGTGMLTWNITDDKSWISYSPNSGTTETEIDEIKVNVDRLGLSPGVHTGNISISSDGGNQNIVISLTVPDEPSLSVSPQTLNFGEAKNAMTFDVANAGTGDLIWSLSDNQEWITANPTSGTNFGTVNVSVNRNSLSPGDYSGTLTVSSNGGTGYVSVQMKMPADEPPTAVTLSNPINITMNSMDVTWSRNYDNDFAAYQIYYSTTPAVTQSSTLFTTITDNNQNSCTITGLTSNTTYYFRVYAMDTAQQTTGSNVVYGTTSAALKSWSLVANISGLTFQSVWFNSVNDGYAVGYSGNYESTSGSGRIYHTVGSSWLPETIPTSYGLCDIRFIDANNGYAVGYNGTFLYFNGVSWATFNSPTTNSIGSVFPISNNDIWCYARSVIYHWNGSQWSVYNLDISDIEDIYFVNANDGWVVDTNGKMFHYNGIGWALHSDLVMGWTATEIFFLNSSEGWYLSYSSYAYHFDGNSWTGYENSNYPVSGVYQLFELSASNVWAVGYGGRIYNFNGAEWKSITSPTSNNLLGIYMISNTDGWAVGSNGVILRYH